MQNGRWNMRPVGRHDYDVDDQHGCRPLGEHRNLEQPNQAKPLVYRASHYPAEYVVRLSFFKGWHYRF